MNNPQLNQQLPKSVFIDNEEIMTSELPEDAKLFLIDLLAIEAQIQNCESESRILEIGKEKLTEVLGLMLGDLE